MAPDENLFENDERAKGDLHDCILKKFSPFYSSKLQFTLFNLIKIDFTFDMFWIYRNKLVINFDWNIYRANNCGFSLSLCLSRWSFISVLQIECQESVCCVELKSLFSQERRKLLTFGNTLENQKKRWWLWWKRSKVDPDSKLSTSAAAAALKRKRIPIASLPLRSTSPYIHLQIKEFLHF